MNGLHLTADLYECRCDLSLLTDAQALSALAREAVAKARLTAVDEKYHAFPSTGHGPGGVTGTVLLAESHLAIHTWPEFRSVTLDVYVCNVTADNSHKAESLMQSLLESLEPGRKIKNRILRGEAPGIEMGFAALREAITPAATLEIQAGPRLATVASPFQTIEVYETPVFGRTLRIDGCNMTTERDEFFYHETMVHPAALVVGKPRKALIIGGGDGGAAEELLKHPSIQNLTLVELDAAVVATARSYLGTIHRGAFDDPRLNVVHSDGDHYLRECQEQYDLILLDLTDPDTPARRLYTADFFQRLRKHLAEPGAVVLNIGSPVFHPQRYRDTLVNLSKVFQCVRDSSVYIPSYGTQWGMATASMQLDPAILDAEQVDKLLAERGIVDLQFYNGGVHQGLFASPHYIQELKASSVEPPSS